MPAFSRRTFALALGAAGLAGAMPQRITLRTAFAQAQEHFPPEPDDETLKRIFVDNSEPLEDEYVLKGLNDWPLWWDQQPLEMAQWPPDAEAIDYAHLPERNAQRSFLLNDAVLRRVVASHSYARLVTNQPLVLVGVRGARRAQPPALEPVYENAIELVEERPDHFDHKCLLVVWDTAAKKVWATAASTAPHVAYLFAQREASTFAHEANMMPTGLYRYSVGTHRNATSSCQPGAFRPDNKAFAVLRCIADGTITMSRRQYWDMRATNHGDNIHAGTFSSRADRPKFWSAGCQVIPGFYSDGNTVPRGDWARFRVAAGLGKTPVITKRREIAPGRFDVATSEDGRKFSYVLTTGRDVLLAGENQSPRTLRFGSSGATVKALQAALGVPTAEQDGIFGLGLQKLLLASGTTKTPIADERLVATLGVTL